MELDKFGRQLRLLELLIDNTSFTTQQLCERIGLSRRSVYRYIDFFRLSGFDVMEHRGIYSIALSSPFFHNLAGRMRLSGSDLETLAQLLSEADGNSPAVNRLRQKLRSMYGVEFSANGAKIDRQVTENTELIQRAIGERRKVILPNYSSPHGRTSSDRCVEPFRLLPGTGDVRCYEESSDMCKTFKIARIGGTVTLLPDHWTAVSRHVNYYTDIFGFSGETTHRVTLRLGLLASRILMEEFGVKDVQMAIDSDGIHRLFTVNVCSYQGLERFVLGLMSDIEIVRGAEFKDHLRRVLRTAIDRLG